MNIETKQENQFSSNAVFFFVYFYWRLLKEKYAKHAYRVNPQLLLSLQEHADVH